MPSVFLSWVFKHCLLLPHFLLSKGWQHTRAPPCYCYIFFPRLNMPPTFFVLWGCCPLLLEWTLWSLLYMSLSLSPAAFRAVVLHTGCKKHRLGIRLQCGRPGSIPGLGRSPGEVHGNPLQYSCLENPHGQRSLAGYSPWGHKESDMTEWLITWRDLILGDVQGSPLVIVITDYHAVVGGVPGGGCSFARLVLESSPKVVLHWEPPV